MEVGGRGGAGRERGEARGGEKRSEAERSEGHVRGRSFQAIREYRRNNQVRETKRSEAIVVLGVGRSIQSRFRNIGVTLPLRSGFACSQGQVYRSAALLQPHWQRSPPVAQALANGCIDLRKSGAGAQIVAGGNLQVVL
jgi:hypothetical protein